MDRDTVSNVTRSENEHRSEDERRSGDEHRSADGNQSGDGDQSDDEHRSAAEHRPNHQRSPATAGRPLDDEPDLSEAVVSIPLDRLGELGMETLYERCTSAGLRDFSELVCSGGGCILHVVTEEPLPADELQALPYVAWWERLREPADGPATSIGKLLPAADASAVDSPAEHGVAPTEHAIADGRLAISLVGDRADLADRVREYERAGSTPTIERLGAYDGASAPLDALTERQETVLRAAHERGYFEVPRKTTTAEIADALDLDDSTVAEHLQRAQRSIVDDLLAE
ncbi:Bacterio-opsin activator HTH domain-containing protein [Salinarchaeum sp. Harcht-Bsk1]|uniref:helix-turn-helix domain-containing protein n=1 Tax=Salinarchaeum sp. Harcht-Bsk1 TaxID=1333523 RepID=UPI00034236E8|nr:helix-turn-helix domain-containing protein [Salinarchaeum sp. Harcht-Bsk1]AGN02406.1 Bacterio-opsin activator HTH domain-containing protein [Salinarchaeum sp. Harcht-Bsk1]